MDERLSPESAQARLQGAGERRSQAGEVLFVPRGVEHRFEDLTNNFATWVFLHGPA